MTQLFCVLILSSLGFSVLATTIDFDDIPAANPFIWASDRYLDSHGARFHTDAGTLYSWSDPSNGQFIATTGTNYVYGGSPLHPWSTFEVSFWLPGDIPAVTDSLSFDVVDYPSETNAQWHAAFYNELNQLIHDELGTASAYTVTHNDPNIHRVVFTPSNDFDGFDTLNFGPLRAAGSNVPEPSSLLLLSAGLVCLTKRKRA